MPIMCVSTALRQRARTRSWPAAGAVVLILSSAASPAVAATATAVEFYNTGLKHYFLTSYPEEVAGVDSGTAGPGWTRTGGEFTVFTDAAPGRVPVCRFYGTPGKGPNSHFYTADAAECEIVKNDAGWTYEGIAYHVQLPVFGNCPDSTYAVYRSYNNRFAQNDSNHRFTVDLTAHVRMPRQGYAPEGVVMCVPISDAEAEADAVRLLEQATLGPTEALVQEVKAKGPAKWLDEQLALNVTKVQQYPYFERPLDPQSCIDDNTPPVTPEKWCLTNKNSPRIVAMEFFRQSRTAPDQLRMRMAHLWHQIFVIAWEKIGMAYAHAEFMQRLRDHAFGTFENLLTKYTLSPQLGHYQNWVWNVPEHDGIKPNENYARELMQLFTIGVNELNEDGTPKLDASGRLIPTYKQSDIEVLARVLTGYFFAPMPAGTVTVNFPHEYYVGDMIPDNSRHDQGAKFALSGRLQLPANGGSQYDVLTLLRVLVDHPNTPPFISRQLIQKMVTSSPSPGYVKRVATVFKDNGRGVRGDLAAVTKAILLDPEARGSRKIDREYGRLREPALFWTNMIRALDVNTDGEIPYYQSGASGQSLYNSPTVFNYYPADFTLAGSSIPAPEFGIFGSVEFINRVNMTTNLMYNSDLTGAFQVDWGPHPGIPNAVGTRSPLLTAFLADAANVETLVSRIDRLLMHGTMRADMRKVVVNAVGKLPASEPAQRVKLAMHLVLTSIDYQEQN